MSDNHTIGDFSATSTTIGTPVDSDNPTRSLNVTAQPGETSAMVSATYKDNSNTQEGAEAYLWVEDGYAELGLMAKANATDAQPQAEVVLLADAAGGTVQFIHSKGNFWLQGFDVTGAQTASFTGATAPVAGLTVKRWLKVYINGVVGYIPWLST